MDVIVLKVALEAGPIRPRELALACLVAGCVLSDVLCTIWPNLNAFTVLLVVLPLALIPGAICMVVDSVSVSLIVHPLAVIDITVHMLKAPIPLGLVILPLPFVLGTVRPNLDTMAMPLFALPRTGVGGPILKGV